MISVSVLYSLTCDCEKPLMNDCLPGVPTLSGLRPSSGLAFLANVA